MPIITTGLAILMELIDLVNSVIISNNLTQITNFPTWIPDWFSQACSVELISFDASICSVMAFPPLGNSDHVVVPVSIDFPSNSQWGCPSSLASLTIFVLIGAVFMIIWEMFHGRISLDLVLLLLLVNFASGFRLELMHISLTESSGQASFIMVFSCLCSSQIS